MNLQGEGSSVRTSNWYSAGWKTDRTRKGGRAGEGGGDTPIVMERADEKKGEGRRAGNKLWARGVWRTCALRICIRWRVNARGTRLVTVER